MPGGLRPNQAAADEGTYLDTPKPGGTIYPSG